MQTFSSFPLRARGVVEQFDAAIKLYKQYFWVLLGWSAIITLSSLISGFISFFLSPIAIGAVVCCVAAAVRGQSVEFGQCWRFTQPRYGALLWYSFVAALAGGLVIAVMIGAMVALFIAGASALANSEMAVRINMGILAFLVCAVIATIVTTVFMSWIGLVPIVICMEDDKRNSQSLGRAYELLRGYWLRITSLMALVGVAMIVLTLILFGVAFAVVGFDNIRKLLTGHSDESAAVIGVLALFGFGGAYTLLWMLWTPLYYLILTVFYLDVRVRKEALDLEWTAHTTAPSTPVELVPAAPAFVAPAPAAPFEQPSEPISASGAFSSPAETYPAENYGTRRLDETPTGSAPLENAPATSPDENGVMPAPSTQPLENSRPDEAPRPQW